MCYVGQINYLLSMLVVTLILSDFLIMMNNFSCLKRLEISETAQKKAQKRVKIREGSNCTREGGVRLQTRQRHKRKEKEQRRCFLLLSGVF